MRLKKLCSRLITQVTHLLHLLVSHSTDLQLLRGVVHLRLCYIWAFSANLHQILVFFRPMKAALLHLSWKTTTYWGYFLLVHISTKRAPKRKGLNQGHWGTAGGTLSSEDNVFGHLRKTCKDLKKKKFRTFWLTLVVQCEVPAPVFEVLVLKNKVQSCTVWLKLNDGGCVVLWVM